MPPINKVNAVNMVNTPPSRPDRGQDARAPHPHPTLHSTRSFLADAAGRALPRILTQVCRDPGAPFYGACDRNWWHYKIRDFPSIILQQAGYALALTANLRSLTPASSLPPCGLQNLARATARFWNTRALKHGAFEEYYPYEQGYPPAAFSTLAVAKLAHMGVVPLDDILPGLKVAARQLTARFEAQAANQQIAGTAALAVIRTIAPKLVSESAFHHILTRILDLQHPEGWFPEYDGPDLGYLAVSIDCLYDIHDHTSDPRVLPAIRKAADFISWFALSPFGGAGMHNSRNTDYITPYGLVRLALEENDPAITATVAAVFNHPVEAVDGRFHPLDAVDDRYWCHYIGHSVIRALLLLDQDQPACQVPSTAHRAPVTAPANKPGSGHALLAGANGTIAMISTRKGGILTAAWPGGATACDFGWIVQSSAKLLVTHWWSNDWEISLPVSEASTKGWLVAHKEHTSEPWKHILLRIGSFPLGHRLIRILKRLVIFKKPVQSHHFSRTVTWDGDVLVIRDTIDGLSEGEQAIRAPRASKRHVASADSFHPEDFQRLDGITKTETITRQDRIFTCETRYSHLA